MSAALTLALVSIALFALSMVFTAFSGYYRKTGQLVLANKLALVSSVAVTLCFSCVLAALVVGVWGWLQ